TDEVPVLDIKLSAEELQNGKKHLEAITQNSSKKTIAFFAYATGAKCYSTEWWNDFYELFYPEYKEKFHLIEILPVENISQLERKLPTYYSKDIRKIASLMANCELIVASDSGMMHLSSASLTPTIGLFSVTSPDVYTPYGNNSTFIDTNNQSKHDIIKAMNQIIEKLH
ncbi:MAG TPA: glycosyltransferase family 9 protein, partial [Flavobacterium sp.]|nr:glycosyltransferase family 9 protein [Flavobacterium sp.]